MKICNKCKINLPLSYFTKDSAKKDKRSNKCKVCANIKYTRNVYESNIYLIMNPAWVDYIKIGRAKNIIDRLKSYQTSSPKRDYELIYSLPFKDSGKVERYFATHYKCLSEWALISKEEAIMVLDKLKEEEEKQLELKNKRLLEQIEDKF